LVRTLSATWLAADRTGGQACADADESRADTSTAEEAGAVLRYQLDRVFDA
jgi:hypothetical protein